MTRRYKTADLTFGAALGLAFGLGCPYDDTDHCSVEDGDAYCARKYAGEQRQYCAVGHGTCEDDYFTEELDGCVEARPVELECYSPCGGRKSAQDDAECEGQAETSSSSVSATATDATTEPTESTTTMGTGSMSTSASETDSETESASSSTTVSGCTMSSECADAASPICVEMACAPCSADTECLDRDPGMPACRDDGQCVACTPSNASACGDTTPVCNAALSECEGCAFHEQCAGTACDIATGACFDDGCVVEVDGDSDAKAEYTNIQPAIADGCVVIVHELDGGLSYQDSLEIDGITVALLSADGEQPLVVGVGGEPSLELTGGATAYVQGLTFSQNTAQGILADAATVYLDRTQVIGNTGGGIEMRNDAAGYLRNCFVEGDSDIVAMTIDGSSADILYTTLGGQFDAPALACTNPINVTVRNSIVVSRAITSDLDCDDAVISYTATEVMVPGAGNVALGDMDMADATTWFDGYNGGNFGLNNPPAAVLTAAQWQLGDPPTDIDGALRPTEDATDDVAGADIP